LPDYFFIYLDAHANAQHDKSLYGFCQTRIIIVIKKQTAHLGGYI